MAETNSVPISMPSSLNAALNTVLRVFVISSPMAPETFVHTSLHALLMGTQFFWMALASFTTALLALSSRPMASASAPAKLTIELREESSWSFRSFASSLLSGLPFRSLPSTSCCWMSRVFSSSAFMFCSASTVPRMLVVMP